MSNILSDFQIRQRLERGEIFRISTWDPASIRAAAYDLRIADDFLVVPDPDFLSGRRYHRGDTRSEPIILRPGDVAFLSTMERLCMPWDLSGHIGIKFSYARRGLLVLTGLLVDPGFGLERDNNDLWVEKSDERLHFLIANVGPNTVALSPGKEKVASIQFFCVEGVKERREVPSGKDMEREFFDPKAAPKVGLSFFRDMADLKARQEKFEERIRAVEAGTGQIIFFGVYLLAASLAIASLLGILSLVSSDRLVGKMESLMRVLPTAWEPALILTSGVLAIAWVVHSVLGFLASVLNRATHRW